ncbi:MAG TPA: heme ABC exporter ATP-binding protein CcmA [Candidatus Binatia bacterium]|nr:heme ABC exporter ATP-binding protein CcmA [Candidatus Binatia bacterium]
MLGPPIRAEGLRRDYAGTPVLAGVDLLVEAGELVVLLGSNGAGKTTLLRVLATLLRPSGGVLSLFGGDARAARRRIGYVGHESGCYADLTGAENLEFHAALHGVPSSRVSELLEWTGLSSAARRPLRTYSRGMSQRLALARALLHRPDLLLLDEPYSGLDPGAAARLDALLVSLRAAGHTILLTTHDLARVVPLSTRVAILHRGRIAWTQAGAVDPVVVASAYDAVVVA